jgi:hypothetical protein
LAITAWQPEVEAGALDRVWRCLQRTMEGSYGRLDADVRLAAAAVTLRAGDGSQTMNDVEGTIETLPAETRAEVHFRLAGVDTPEPIGIRIVRNRQVSPPEANCPATCWRWAWRNSSRWARDVASAAAFGPTRRPMVGKAK